jgi:hypothetical protein
MHREIDLEVKWVYVPTLMTQEPVFFPRVVLTPAVHLFGNYFLFLQTRGIL